MEEFRWKSDRERIKREQEAITKPILAKREVERKIAEFKKRSQGIMSGEVILRPHNAGADPVSLR